MGLREIGRFPGCTELRSITVALALSVALTGPTPCGASAGGGPPIEKEVYAALAHIQAGEPDDAVPVGVALLREHPGDWRSWYIRFLTAGVQPLTALEEAGLEQIPQAKGRESIRALRAYLAAPPEMRMVLARDVVGRNPDDALGHTLLASSLLAAGEVDDALEAAARALELDPEHFLAARVRLAAIEMTDDGSEVQLDGCELLERFPSDPMIVGAGLRVCRPPAIPEIRYRYFGPLLRFMRGRTEIPVALQRILGPPNPPAPLSVLEGIMAALEPTDAQWWGFARELLTPLMEQGASLGTPGAREFLSAAIGAARNAPSPDREELIDVAGRASARALRLQGHFDDARSILGFAMAEVFPLQRVPHLEEFARIAQAQGRDAEARRFREDAFALAHPYVEAPADESRTQRLFPRLRTYRLQDESGNERALAADGRRPLILIFWKADCLWAAKEAEQVDRLLGEADNVLTRNDADVLWINFDEPDRRVRAQQQAEKLRLPTRSRLFVDERDRSILHDLHVAGSPSLFVAAPDGMLVLHVAGFDPSTWKVEIPGMLEAMRRREPRITSWMQP